MDQVLGHKEIIKIYHEADYFVRKWQGRYLEVMKTDKDRYELTKVIENINNFPLKSIERRLKDHVKLMMNEVFEKEHVNLEDLLIFHSQPTIPYASHLECQYTFTDGTTGCYSPTQKLELDEILSLCEQPIFRELYDKYEDFMLPSGDEIFEKIIQLVQFKTYDFVANVFQEEDIVKHIDRPNVKIKLGSYYDDWVFLLFESTSKTP